ncbi:hypothetical protein ACQ5SO_14585 [Rhodovulum sp. DZ06]|uniref:hypothetical protein n=1 Tax=Rhodovulum sp. DZ06 TaxID=3425126 RepID=UPI003D33341F
MSFDAFIFKAAADFSKDGGDGLIVDDDRPFPSTGDGGHGDDWCDLLSMGGGVLDEAPGGETHWFDGGLLI